MEFISKQWIAIIAVAIAIIALLLGVSRHKGGEAADFYRDVAGKDLTVTITGQPNARVIVIDSSNGLPQPIANSSSVAIPAPGGTVTIPNGTHYLLFPEYQAADGTWKMLEVIHAVPGANGAAVLTCASAFVDEGGTHGIMITIQV